MTRLLYIILILLALPLTTLGKEKDYTLNYGISFLPLYANDYRGSDQARFHYYPFPYFKYVSDKIEAEPSYIHGEFYSNPFFKLKMSVIAGLRVDSKKNNARNGMPDLGYTIEAGPMIYSKLWQSTDKVTKLVFAMPMRKVFATDFRHDLRTAGYFSIPFFELSVKGTERTFGWKQTFSIGFPIGSSDNHKHYYEVEQKFETSGRPTYSPSGGYGGTSFVYTGYKRFNGLALLPFIRYDILNKASFESSPLVKKKRYLISGLTFFYLFD
jgi:MipA family protein